MLLGVCTREGRAAEQRDAADEGRLELSGSIVVGTVIVNERKVMRPSQLIASVLRTAESSRQGQVTPQA